MWQQIWFVVNIVFVGLLIGFLFAHRSVTMAEQQKDGNRRRSAAKSRLVLGILTILAFVAMAVSFLASMRAGAS
jgi:uncharacterized membrane protein